MGKLLVIGNGGVGRVSAHKAMQMPEVFSEVTVASRDFKKLEPFREEIRRVYGRDIKIEQVDADNQDRVSDLLRKVRPDVVVNVALPYQNEPISEACLENRVHYIDTATPEVRNEPGFSYRPQWRKQTRFEKAGVMLLAGFGYDPGRTSADVAWLIKHHFDNNPGNVDKIEILDCNAGNHGRVFATNFNPVTNIREVLLPTRRYVASTFGFVDGPRIIDPGARHGLFPFPLFGQKDSLMRDAYLLYHEEEESLARSFPWVDIDFYMTFGPVYIAHLKAFDKYGISSSTPLEFASNRVSPGELIKRLAPNLAKDEANFELLKNLGMLDDRKIEFGSNHIRPVEILGSVLPDPRSLAPGYTGYTSICTIVTGKVDGRDRRVMIYNSCDHAACVRETGQHGISYTAGVPPAIAAEMIVRGHWKGAGVFNPEQLDPDPWMGSMARNGLPYVIEENCTRRVASD